MSALAQDALLRQYKEGMQDGVLMTLDMLLGETSEPIIPADQFEELRFKGPLTEEVRDYLEASRANALEERRESGR